MYRKMVFFAVVILFIFSAHTIHAQWRFYDCTLLPAEADTAWHEDGDTPDDVTTYLSVVDDPDIAGNKLIQFLEAQGPAKEMWYLNWHADPVVGATLVFRAKALQVGAYDRDFELYIYNGVVRERLVSNNGVEIKFDKSKVLSPMDTGIWHIYRVTVFGDYFTVYVDEDILPYLEAIGETIDGETNLFRFGDLGSSTMGSLYDWFIWDVSGAYPPGEGTPIPEELLTTGSMTDVAPDYSRSPDDFRLLQNFPNPFNPATEIEYHLDKGALVKLNVFTLNGQLVRSLVTEYRVPGVYRAEWDGRDMNNNLMPSGIYLYSLETGSSKSVRKMILSK